MQVTSLWFVETENLLHVNSLLSSRHLLFRATRAMQNNKIDMCIICASVGVQHVFALNCVMTLHATELFSGFCVGVLCLYHVHFIVVVFLGVCLGGYVQYKNRKKKRRSEMRVLGHQAFVLSAEDVHVELRMIRSDFKRMGVKDCGRECLSAGKGSC